ncbi:hypothetical protein TrST_g1069 [Triparma strigata]|uniref:Sulfotransferase n=1 Tax=Triparma strigata TaxID=1606541 RepID=A0A9W7E0L8_9STRA|nr:hypothetical protein TrST_g1069 [Triparma strigata]
MEGGGGAEGQRLGGKRKSPDGEMSSGAPESGGFSVLMGAMNDQVGVKPTKKKKRRKDEGRERNANSDAVAPRTIPKIKIYGERNSGTNFLQTLLMQNCWATILDPTYQHGWKHGYPDESHVEKRDRPFAVYVFIVRDLNDWLHSTFKSPYHMLRHDRFEDFVISKVVADEARADHPVVKDPRETNVRPLDMFAAKYAAYRSFVESHRSIIVNLKYVQTFPKKFVEELTTHFPSIRAQEYFKAVEKHTKTKEVFNVGKEVCEEKEKLRPKELDKYVELEEEICELRAEFWGGEVSE